MSCKKNILNFFLLVSVARPLGAGPRAYNLLIAPLDTLLYLVMLIHSQIYGTFYRCKDNLQINHIKSN